MDTPDIPTALETLDSFLRLIRHFRPLTRKDDDKAFERIAEALFGVREDLQKQIDEIKVNQEEVLRRVVIFQSALQETVFETRARRARRLANVAASCRNLNTRDDQFTDLIAGALHGITLGEIDLLIEVVGGQYESIFGWPEEKTFSPGLGADYGERRLNLEGDEVRVTIARRLAGSGMFVDWHTEPERAIGGAAVWRLSKLGETIAHLVANEGELPVP